MKVRMLLQWKPCKPDSQTHMKTKESNLEVSQKPRKREPQ